MIVGIGVDTVEIERFAHWAGYSACRLSKIFSADEIAYCLAKPELSAQRFAVRFAAKEALYKALCAGGIQCQFFFMCRFVEIKSNGAAPMFFVNWKQLHVATLRVHVSLSHSRTLAQAFVVVETSD